MKSNRKAFAISVAFLIIVSIILNLIIINNTYGAKEKDVEWQEKQAFVKGK